jgi:hypothetical protein
MKNKFSKYEREIKMDLDRTFPDLEFFKNKKKLIFVFLFFSSKNVFIFSSENLFYELKALSNSFPKIGYTQGLNAWVAIFLMKGLNQNECFWAMIYFMNKLKFKELLYPGFPRIEILNFQLEVYMNVYMRKISNHLVSLIFFSHLNEN